MKWGPQAKLIDEALLKYYFVNISLLSRYICIQHTKSVLHIQRPSYGLGYLLSEAVMIAT